MKTQTITLLRHGKVTAAPALNGSTDVPVDAALQGEIAHALVAKFARMPRVIASPLSRCQDLARRLGDITAQSYTLDRAFQEVSFGDFDGVPFEALKEHWDKLEAFWRDPATHTLPNGEPLADFHARVISGWHELLDQHEEDVLLITHGGVIRMLIAEILGVDWRLPSWYASLSIANASTTHIEVIRADKRYLKINGIGVPLV